MVSRGHSAHDIIGPGDVYIQSDTLRRTRFLLLADRVFRFRFAVDIRATPHAENKTRSSQPS